MTSLIVYLTAAAASTTLATGLLQRWTRQRDEES